MLYLETVETLVLVHTWCVDAVTPADLQRVGEKLLHSNPAMAVIGELEDVPKKREVEAALFENGGLLTSRKSFFSFS